MTDFFDRLPLSLRSEPQGQLESDEGTWILSRTSQGLLDLSRAWGCGVPGTNWCTYEYGEILLVDDSGSLVRAVPMPAVPPKWIAVMGDFVYAGAVADGGLPAWAVVRINRETLEATVIVFEYYAEHVTTWPAGSIVVAAGDPRQAELAEAVRHEPFAGGSEVVSAIGPLFVDLEAVSDFFDQLDD